MLYAFMGIDQANLSAPATEKTAATLALGHLIYDRIIIHLDMNAFFTSVEQLANPTLRGRPVIVGGDPNGRSVVSSASYEARVFGIKAGMPLKQAMRLCPQAELVVGDMAKYENASARVFQLMAEFSPLMEVFSTDRQAGQQP